MMGQNLLMYQALTPWIRQNKLQSFKAFLPVFTGIHQQNNKLQQQKKFPPKLYKKRVVLNLIFDVKVALLALQ